MFLFFGCPLLVLRFAAQVCHSGVVALAYAPLPCRTAPCFSGYGTLALAQGAVRQGRRRSVKCHKGGERAGSADHTCPALPGLPI